jgi:formate dehydrogenase iron-sulfur subunit
VTLADNRLYGPLADPAGEAGHVDHPPRVGFFTDTSVCIGCKACEVACKTWNAVPEDGINLLGMSYDNTGMLGANTWRHVAFIEQARSIELPDTGLTGLPVGPPASESVAASVADAMQGQDLSSLGTDGSDIALPAAPGATAAPPDGDVRSSVRWLMASDVCKHCTHAACLDVCPTGALVRTEFGTVVVQDDVCNGCGYCIPACPFGVIDQRKGPAGEKNVGLAQKCTLCYDRLTDGLPPACAKACPTESIQYGELDELRERAATRLATLHEAGVSDARLYGNDPNDGVGGVGAFFLLLDEPEVYGLPPDPVVTTRDLPAMWRSAAAAAALMLTGALAAFAGRRR